MKNLIKRLRDTQHQVCLDGDVDMYGLLGNAADALEKQIPQKPIRESLADRACPVCDAYIPFDALNDKIEDAPNFCKNCGQALDWEV